MASASASASVRAWWAGARRARARPCGPPCPEARPRSRIPGTIGPARRRGTQLAPTVVPAAAPTAKSPSSSRRQKVVRSGSTTVPAKRVEVLQMGCVGTPIIRGPRPLPGPDRYTLVREEPRNHTARVAVLGRFDTAWRTSQVTIRQATATISVSRKAISPSSSPYLA